MGHDIKTCPDKQDSVYFAPTSVTPFDSFKAGCLPPEKWRVTKHNWVNYMGGAAHCELKGLGVTQNKEWRKKYNIDLDSLTKY